MTDRETQENGMAMVDRNLRDTQQVLRYAFLMQWFLRILLSPSIALVLLLDRKVLEFSSCLR